MCIESTIVEGTSIMQIQPKSGLLPEALFLVANMLPWKPYCHGDVIGCYGNIIMLPCQPYKCVKICAK